MNERTVFALTIGAVILAPFILALIIILDALT